MRHPLDIVTRISRSSATLSPAEQKVAQMVLGDLTQAAAGSIRTLAGRAGVSEASVTRFAKTMGCRDVRELKLHLAQAVAVGKRFLVEGGEHAPSSADAIVADVVQMLELHRKLVPPRALRDAAALLAAARMTLVFGMGGASTTLADEMRYRLMRLGLPVATYHDAVLQRMAAVTLGREDVVLVYSTTGRVPELNDCVGVVRDYGARVVAVTAPDSPLAQLADVLLPVQTLETDFIYKPSASRYALLLVTDLLVTEVALRQAERSKEMLRRIKHVLDAHRGGGDRQPLGD